MTTLGEILQTAREKKKLTIEQVEKATKIRSKFIVALEQNQFDKLPGPTFARGFVKNYAAFLGLSPDETLAFYRRQANDNPLKVVPKETIVSVGGRWLTPQRFTAVSIGLLLVAFFSYLAFSYWQFAGTPVLIINNPVNNLVMAQDSVEVIGKTDPGATLMINNEPVTTSENGSFDVKVPLSPGLNTLTVTATNKFGKKSTVVRNLRLEK